MSKPLSDGLASPLTVLIIKQNSCDSPTCSRVHLMAMPWLHKVTKSIPIVAGDCYCCSWKWTLRWGMEVPTTELNQPAESRAGFIFWTDYAGSKGQGHSSRSRLKTRWQICWQSWLAWMHGGVWILQCNWQQEHFKDSSCNGFCGIWSSQWSSPPSQPETKPIWTRPKYCRCIVCTNLRCA